MAEGSKYSMTNQEAIERIADHMFVHKLKEERAHYITQALQLAIESLKKQEPETVTIVADGVLNDIYAGLCPLCGRVITNKQGDPTYFCKFCGQAVKW